MDWDKLKAETDKIKEGVSPSYIAGCPTPDLARLAIAGKALAEAVRAYDRANDDFNEDRITVGAVANAYEASMAALAAWDTAEKGAGQ